MKTKMLQKIILKLYKYHRNLNNVLIDKKYE